MDEKQRRASRASGLDWAVRVALVAVAGIALVFTFDEVRQSVASALGPPTTVRATSTVQDSVQAATDTGSESVSDSGKHKGQGPDAPGNRRARGRADQPAPTTDEGTTTTTTVAVTTSTSSTTSAPPAPTTTSTTTTSTTTTTTTSTTTTTTTTPPPTTSTTQPPPSTTTTTTPTTTTTTPPSHEILWRWDYENGTDRGWDTEGGIYNSGDVGLRVVSSPAIGGYAHALTINSDGAGVRLTYQGRSNCPECIPDTSTQSAMRLFPTAEDPSWWNVWQWKQKTSSGASNKLFSIDLYMGSDGQMYPRLLSRIQADGSWGSNRQVAKGTVPIETGVWQRWETLYEWSTTNGRIIFWLDGVRVLSYTGKTEMQQTGDWVAPNAWHREWIVGNYGEGMNLPVTIYVDDVEVRR